MLACQQQDTLQVLLHSRKQNQTKINVKFDDAKDESVIEPLCNC